MQGKLNWGRVLLSGASLAALSAGVSYAQDVEVSDEIIVTATGRAAAIQDVPIAVTAVSSEAVENAGVRDIRDLQQLAPSYRFFTGQSNSAGTTAYIRGLGTGGDNPGFESAVGFFVDGVYRNRSGVALSDLPEVDRIEVLRGPQGTLFGRNTTAGAISVVTAGPEFDTHAWMTGSAGDYGYASAQVGMTGPLIEDTLAVRVDLAGTVRDGFITDVNSGDKLNDRNRSSARAQVLWDITPDASFRLILDGAQTDEICCGAVTVASTGVIPSIVNDIAADNGVVGTVSPDPEARTMAVTPGREYNEAIDEWGVSGQLDWQFGDVNLTSITAYRDWEALRDQDVDFSGIDRAYRDDYLSSFKTLSEEIRLQGEWGRLNWLVGGYYSSEKLNLRDTISFGDDAGAYVDGLATVAAGAQLYGNSGPSDFTSVVTGVGVPNAYGATALTVAYAGATGDATPTSAEAFAFAAPRSGSDPLAAARAQLRAVYAGYSAAFEATDPSGGGGQNDRYSVKTTTMALFTHNEIALTDALTFTIGARYNHEEKDLSAILANVDASAAASSCQLLNTQLNSSSALDSNTAAAFVANTGSLFPLICSPAVNEQAVGSYFDEREDNEWNGTASLAYKITDDLMVYGLYSRGYKAGGYNLDRLGFDFALTGGAGGTPDPTVSPSTDDLEFKPEFVDAYELGWKWSGFNGGLVLNGAAYYQQIEDYQLLAFTGFNFTTSNVSQAISKGAELDFTLRPLDNLTVQGGVAYNDAYYDVAISDNAPVDPEILPAGTKFAHAPEWTVTSAVTYEQPISESLVALFYVDGRWNSEYATQTFGREANGATDNEAFAVFNARLGIGAEDKRWSVETWVRNLTDEFYYVGSFAVPEQTSAALGGGNYNIYPSDPRTWGVTLRARY